ncbi:SWIM zinc finger family protein [Psychromonas ossibalaenae]|uniref:SWIM zinc finger family protein n=1 Tax=Psychromonas ossibalaenae TaxID=444922 RepID=UPI000371EDBF|nr:SWIM zinc finger family protein [Psychromonas ossibalaenae]
MFNLNEIKLRAQSKSYQLGSLLYLSGKVRLLSAAGDTVTAIVSGQHDYHVRLIQGEPIQNRCSCPAADYQDLCKHCVAVALLVENTPVEEIDSEAAGHVQLQEWFKQKSADELTGFLMTYIESSEHEFDKWLVIMRSEENGLGYVELSELISKALPEESVWNWDEVKSYFTHAEQMFAVIFPAIEKLPLAKQWSCILKALRRLNKVLEHVHDGGGFRFYLEGELKQKLVALFKLQNWSAEKKAQWLFSHFEPFAYDVFPEIPEDFELSEQVRQLFLAKCLNSAESKSQSGEVNDREQKWSIKRLTQPLIEQAEQDGNWQEQCRLMNMSASTHSDYLAISSVCLENDEALDAEDWLRQAYKHAATPYEKERCQEHEVKVRAAQGEYKSAWRTAWQLFVDNPSFMTYKKLDKLQLQTGEIDAHFIEKAEQILAGCYAESSRGLPANADALLDFYLYRGELEKARLWAVSHKAGAAKLIKLADLIIAEHPQDCVDLTHRAADSIIYQANNSAYQQAADLLVKLEKNLKVNNVDRDILHLMIAKIIKQHKAKRNMMKLLKDQFACCFM